MSVQRKAFRALVKGTGPNGSTRLVVATLNVPDADNDVTLPGFFGRQTVAVVPAHDWSHVPLGKGTLYEQGSEALVDVDWNLDIPEARSWFAAVKFDLENPPALQQWSYGFSLRPGGSRKGEWNERPVQFLQPLADGSPGAVVHEASPVLLGAGRQTRTIAVDGGVDVAREYARFVTSVRADQMAAQHEVDREFARFVRSQMERVA